MNEKNSQLEKLYILRDKTTARKTAAQHNIATTEKQITELKADIRGYQGELSMAEYVLDYINQFIKDLESGCEKLNETDLPTM